MTVLPVCASKHLSLASSSQGAATAVGATNRETLIYIVTISMYSWLCVCVIYIYKVKLLKGALEENFRGTEGRQGTGPWRLLQIVKILRDATQKKIDKCWMKVWIMCLHTHTDTHSYNSTTASCCGKVQLQPSLAPDNSAAFSPRQIFPTFSFVVFLFLHTPSFNLSSFFFFGYFQVLFL